MSSAPIWSGNLHQLRSYVGSSCCFRILKYHATFFPGKRFDPRRYYLHPSAIMIDRRNQSSHRSESCDVNQSGPDRTFKISKNFKKMKTVFCEYKSAQLCHIQKISASKLYDLPAAILAFDTETTGISRVWGRIIEIAIRDILGGQNSTFQTLINPGRAVPNTKIHGISSDMVSKPGIPSFKELIPILLQFVNSRAGSGKPVLWIAHNARVFDVPFLIKEFQRCSMGIPEDWFFLDTLCLARQLREPDGSRLSSCSLHALRERYKIPLVGQAHRAMQDVDTLACVVHRLTFELNLTVPKLMQIAFRPDDIVAKSK